MKFHLHNALFDSLEITFNEYMILYERDVELFEINFKTYPVSGSFFLLI